MVPGGRGQMLGKIMTECCGRSKHLVIEIKPPEFERATLTITRFNGRGVVNVTYKNICNGRPHTHGGEYVDGEGSGINNVKLFGN